ncbi:hypothetical protein ACU686_01270 [Yinghuangia aomiensis]
MDRFPIRHVLGASLVLMAAALAVPYVIDRFGTLGYPGIAVSSVCSARAPAWRPPSHR